MKANDPERMSKLNDAISLFVSKNKINAANMPKCTGALPYNSWYLGIQEKAEVFQMPASKTSHQPQTWLILRVVAETGECHLQLQE